MWTWSKRRKQKRGAILSSGIKNNSQYVTSLSWRDFTTCFVTRRNLEIGSRDVETNWLGRFIRYTLWNFLSLTSRSVSIHQTSLCSIFLCFLLPSWFSHIILLYSYHISPIFNIKKKTEKKTNLSKQKIINFTDGKNL